MMFVDVIFCSAQYRLGRLISQHMQAGVHIITAVCLFGNRKIHISIRVALIETACI